MANVDQYINQTNQNRQRFQQNQDQENDLLNGQINQYGDLESGYRGQADQAYGDLANNPGYTQDESNRIYGNPNAGFQYYNPDQLSQDVNNEGADLSNAYNDYSGNLYGESSNFRNDITGASDAYGSGVRGAADQLAGGLNSAAQEGQSLVQRPGQEELGDLGQAYTYLRGENEGALGGLNQGLDSAVDQDKLGLSQQFAKDYQLSPEQAQNFRDVAANTTKGQYDKLSQEADIQAAGQGNTSPAALAAIKQNLMRQGAIDAGTSASAAELAANKEAAGRQQTLESMRLGANQDVSSRLQQNANTRYGAQQGAAQNLASLEQQGVESAFGHQLSGAQTAAELGYNAAGTGGAARLNAAQSAGQNAYDAAQQSGNMAYNTAQNVGNTKLGITQNLGNQRLAIDSGNQIAGQNLATNADAAGSQRGQTVANQRITGQNNYRSYLTGQQGAAQQGKQTSTGQQLQNNQQEGNLQNQATQTGSQAAQAKDNKPSMFSQIAGAATGAAAAFFAKGGVVDRPTYGVVGENGPEWVGPAEDLGYGALPNARPMTQQGAMPQMQPRMPHIGSRIADAASGAWGGMNGRMDGHNVPGNEPGGANGSFGRYGQRPDMQPTDSMKDHIAQAAKGAQMNDGGWGQVGANLGSAAGGIMRYRAQKQMNQNMNDQMGSSMAQRPQYGAQNLDTPMARGGIVTKPTRVLLGESGPEAVVPLSGNPNATLTPGMMAPRRYRPTGPTSLHHPMGPMAPAFADPHMKASGWKKWDQEHSRV